VLCIACATAWVTTELSACLPTAIDVAVAVTVVTAALI